MPLPDSQLNHCKNQKGPANWPGPFLPCFPFLGFAWAQGNFCQESPTQGEEDKRLCSWTDKKLPRVLADTGQ